MKTPSNVQIALEIEGMTTDLGLMIMDRFLEKATDHHPDGLCFEFGTYKGRTAALIATYLGNDNWLHALEQSDYLEIERLHGISPNITWHREKSEKFCVEQLAEVVGDSEISYTHHDASHFFNNVQTELVHVVDKMASHGVIVLDDFGDTYSQVRAAYYYLRYAKGFPYELLMIGFNKAILVHQDKFDYYEDYVLNKLLDELEQSGANFLLTRSDINIHSRSFFLNLRTDPDAGRLYGTGWWGERFYQPSHSFLKMDNDRKLAISA